MTEVFVDSTFSTNKQGFDLYCVLTEYNLVSLPLSYLLLARSPRRWQEGIAVNGVVHGIANAGLKPNCCPHRQRFCSLAFGRNSSAHNHHLCLWHSLRAIDHISQVSESQLNQLILQGSPRQRQLSLVICTFV
ncbi:hypothetical protein V1505DRAFT_199592 [Lipomyces doorenjongii]